MPAEYLALDDTEFDLAPGQVQAFNFDLPNQVIRSGRRKPLMSFMVKPEPNLGKMKFDVDINDEHQLHNFEIGGDEKGVFWEVINNDETRVGSNTIQFRVVEGFGRVTFSDVVIWYQRA